MQYRTAYQSALRFNNVLKNTEYPYCCIGLLVGTRAIGTAFLIGTNLLLTCAHNILHKTVEKKSD
jgi:V8-like Glu-specific endopeptidase